MNLVAAPEVVEARRNVAAAAVIAILGEGTVAVVDARATGFGADSAVRLVHVSLAALALAMVLRVRHGGVRMTEVAFALVAIPFLPALAVATVRFAALGVPRDQLSWYKLVMLGVASLAPGNPWWPALVIVLLGAQAVALRFLLGERSPMAGEPWITATFAVVAVVMLVSRARRSEAAARAARVIAYASALERMTKLLVRVRDRANTPLQTIDLGVALIARRCPQERRLSTAMQHAVARLRTLSTALQRATRAVERSSQKTRLASARPRRRVRREAR